MGDPVRVWVMAVNLGSTPPAGALTPNAQTLAAYIHDRRQTPPHPAPQCWGSGIYIYCQGPMWPKCAPFSRK